PGVVPLVVGGVAVARLWLVHCICLREPPHEPEAARAIGTGAAIAPFRSLRDAFTAGDGKRGAPRFFAACLLFQMAFQSLSSWFTLHGSERFQTTVANVSLGFIAVAISTLIGSMPAGWLGARCGPRRRSP